MLVDARAMRRLRGTGAGIQNAGESPMGRNRKIGWSTIFGLLLSSKLAVFLLTACQGDTQTGSRDVITLQQQAVLKSALDNAISQFIAGGKTVDEARVYYNYEGTALATPRTMLSKLQLLEPYLDEETYDHFLAHSSDSEIRSLAMIKQEQYLVFSFWAPSTTGNRTTYPRVELLDATPTSGWDKFSPREKSILKWLFVTIAAGLSLLGVLALLLRGRRA